LGVKAEETQDAQIILRDPETRIADEAHMPGLEIGQPADRVVDGAVTVAIERIHGEVAPLGVMLPAAAEAHRCGPAMGLHVLAQGGHLIGRAPRDQRDGTVVEACRHGLEPVGGRLFHHCGRLRRRRDVDIGGRQAKQRVAHGAANHARGVAIGLQRVKDGLKCRLMQPVRGDPRGHCVAPYS
jgi:hypothetical protein